MNSIQKIISIWGESRGIERKRRLISHLQELDWPITKGRKRNKKKREKIKTAQRRNHKKKQSTQDFLKLITTNYSLSTNLREAQDSQTWRSRSHYYQYQTKKDIKKSAWTKEEEEKLKTSYTTIWIKRMKKRQ